MVSQDGEGYWCIPCTDLHVLHDAAYLCRAVLEVLFDHEDSLLSLPLRSQLSLFMTAKDWPAASFLSFAKFLTAWPMACYLENDLPKVPTDWVLTHGTVPDFRDNFDGRLSKYLKNRLAIKSHRNLHLWWSWLQGVKRGCAPATDANVISNLEDHAQVLGTEGSLFDLPEDSPILMDLQSKAAKYWDRVANFNVPPALRRINRSPRVCLTRKDDIRCYPTSGASWESNRAEGGTYNWLYDYFHHEVDRNDPHPLDRDPWLQVRRSVRELHCQDLIKMWWNPKKQAVVEERGILLSESVESLIECSRQEDSRFNHKNVKIIPLREPLKIRTISKGNALKYWLAKPLQRVMRDLNQRSPQMVLTGAPLTVEHLEWLDASTDAMVERVRPFCRDLDLDFTHWVSGDYKGATDRLDIRATKIAFESLLRIIDTDLAYDRQRVVELWKDTVRDVLYEQKLVYPDGGPDSVNQCNGQLMGSNLSFPILCVINLIGYWQTLEEYTDLKFEPNDLPVLINGDDILFRCPKPRSDQDSFYEIWKAKTKALGFELSVGKNYIHDRHFTINSEMWTISRQSGRPTFVRTRHLDVGLLINENGSQRLETRVLPLADRIERTLDGACNKPRIWRRLKHYYSTELKEWMQHGRHTTFNVFAHRALGGLGVPTHGIDPCWTAFQRRFAAFLRRKIITTDDLCHLKDFEALAIGVDLEGRGVSYEIPKCSSSIEWVTKESSLEVPDDLRIKKDIRQLPVLSRPLPVTRESWVKKYSIRSLRQFRRALNDHVLSLDSDPAVFDRVPIRKSLCFEDSSHLVPNRIANQASALADVDGQQTARDKLDLLVSFVMGEQSVDDFWSFIPPLLDDRCS